MKIAFLAPRFHTNQISIIKYLLKNKKHVSFYVTRISQIEDHSVLKPILIDLNYFFKMFKFLINSINPLFDYRYGLPSISQLLRFRSNKYDLLIIRDPVNLMGLSFLLWAKLIGIKIILYIQRDVYKKNSFSAKEIVEKILIKLFKTQCISPCLGNQKYKKFTNKITYLPFCLPVTDYSKNWFINNKINIITVGKFVFRKKHLLLISALRKIKVKNNFKLTIIGECLSKENLNYLKSIKKQAKISNLDINILKNVKPKILKNIYKKHDLFVLASVNEPASISNLEAMAHGLPVITTDTNKTSCYTEHGVNGYIVKSNDLNDLVKKLELLIDNKIRLKKFGKKSFNIVKNKHRPEFIYKKFFNSVMKF
jgi:glycosyltransferase involved in cell wall biosynthesis